MVAETHEFIAAAGNAPVKLKLVRDRTRILKQGYPWIYRDWLAETPKAAPGSRAMVKDKDGSLLAFGMYDPQSPLSVRVCALEEERLNDELIAGRLRRALDLRRRLFDERTTGFRLLNGEGDGLPGMVCDVYDTHAVIRFDGDGPSGFWNKETVAQWLIEHASVEVVYEKFRSGRSPGQAIIGPAPTKSIQFKEHGLSFAADIIHGQKTGFFFDQRDNRERIRLLADNRKVLNLCGYTGGFSIYAGVGGAQSVTTVDLAKPAVEAARNNWALNQLPAERHTTVAADVFEFLKVARTEKRSWDLIIVDPPSFAPAEKHVERAKEGYQSMFAAALGTLEPGGIIAFSSCSSHITAPMFLELCQASLSKARRRGTVLGVYGQPEDHPFPLACTELQYLKFVTVRVV